MRLLALAALSALAACSSTDTTSADVSSKTPSFSGTWIGTITSTVNGKNQSFPSTLNLQHNGTKITGTFVGLPGVLDLTAGTSTGSQIPFSGTLKVSSGSGKCTPATFNVSTTFDASNGTMTGTTSGTNEDCITESNALNFKRQ